MSADRSTPETVAEDAERVRTEYARRATDPTLERYYERVGPAMAEAARDRQQRILAVIDALGPRDQVRVLEVGCGSGEDLAALVDAGLDPVRVAGIDLLDADIARASARLPGSRIVVANAAATPFEDRAFDLVFQVVMLSSVVAPDVRIAIAAEMRRVVRPGGRIVSYDMTTIADGNPHLVAIDRAELERLFGRDPMEVQRVTLFLPIASRVPGPLRGVFAAVPWLRRHLIAVVTVGPA